MKNKKRLTFLLTFVISFLFCIQYCFSANSNEEFVSVEEFKKFDIFLNGEKLDLDGFLLYPNDWEYYVHIRDFAEKLGYVVEWQEGEEV